MVALALAGKNYKQALEKGMEKELIQVKRELVRAALQGINSTINCLKDEVPVKVLGITMTPGLIWIVLTTCISLLLATINESYKRNIVQ
jgi:hypothetical protein